MPTKPEAVVIDRDHFAAVFISTDGERLLLVRERGQIPILYERDHAIEVEEVEKLHGSATTWVASGLILANDEGVWLKTPWTSPNKLAGGRMKRNVCASCGKPYFRRNLLEGWDEQNPGHRTGWDKKTVRICTHCQTAAQTHRILTQVKFAVVPKKDRDRQAS